MPEIIPAVAAIAGSISWGAIATQVAVGVGAALLSSALAPHTANAASGPNGSDLSVQIGANTPVQFPVGWSATPGMTSYAGTRGEEGSTPNAYAVFETILSFLPVPGKPVPWIGTQKCTVDWDATPQEKGYPITDFRVHGTDYAWIDYDDGTQTEASVYMVDKFGSHPTRPYTSDMVGYGLAKVRLTLLLNNSLWSSVPDVLYETSGIPLYNPAKDSSIGGSGSHRWGDFSTYEPSNNPAVQIYNLRRGIFYYPASGDAQWVYGGNNKRALSAYRLPASSWIAAINACDTTVTNADDTTEAQFRAGMLLTCDTQPADAITPLLGACQGRFAEVGGIYELSCGAPGAAVYSFTDADIIISDAQNATPFPGLSDTYNAVEATYPEPSQKWASNNAPGRYNDGNNGTPDWEDEDGGRQLVASAQFNAVPYANQVQRLTQGIANDNRQFRVHQVTLPPDAYDVVKPNRVVSWTSKDFGYTDKQFIVTSGAGRQTWNQQVTIKELDPSDYDFDPATQQLPSSVGTLTFETAPPQPMSGWGASPSTLNNSDGDAVAPAITVSCSGLMQDVQSVHVQARLTGTTGICYDGYAPYDPTVTSPAWQISGAWCIGATAYDVRGKLDPFSGRQTYWSNETLDDDGNLVEGDWLGVTTEDVSSGNDNIQRTQLAAALQAVLAFLQSTVTDLQAQMDALASVAQDQDTANYLDKQTFTEQLGSSIASYTTQIGLLATTISAISAKTETLSAALGGNSAQVNVAWEAVAAPTGYSARYAISCSVNDGTPRVATFFIDVPADTTQPTRIGVQAGQFVAFDDSGVAQEIFEGDTAEFNNALIVGLTADNIEAGSITADRLDVTTLSAISADLGTITGGTISLGGGLLVMDGPNSRILVSDS